MSRPRLRRRTSAVSFTGRSSSGRSSSGELLLSDVTVKMSPPCPRRTLLTRTGSSASGRTITSPTSTSPAGITFSTNRDDTGQEDQLHVESERTVSHISTPGDVDPGPGHDLGDPPSPVRRGLRRGSRPRAAADVPGAWRVLRGFPVCSWQVTLRSRRWRSSGGPGLVALTPHLPGRGPDRPTAAGGTWGTGGGRSWSHRAGSELPGRLCERLRRVGQPRRGVAASRWWRIRGGGAA